MKTSDFIAQFIADQGVTHAFVVSGGCIVHVIDSIARTPGIDYIPVQHEQAGAMAADGHARMTGGLGVALATSGPGATNLLTGICCSYYDSIPTLYITGQVPAGHLKRNNRSRQIGFQETDVVSIFESVTKYATLVDDAKNIRHELEKAVHIARSGRPGPVLVDVCDDVQRAEIDPDALRGFTPDPETVSGEEPPALRAGSGLEAKVAELLSLLEQAERPVLILGAGVRLAGCVTEARRFVEAVGTPVAPTWGALDLIPHSNPLVVGTFGVTAGRAGNFAVQNADLVVAIGTRLDTHETGSNLAHFARGARKVVIDIDRSELEKYEARGMRVDLPIHADARDFFAVANAAAAARHFPGYGTWKERVATWKSRYPICRESYRKQSKHVNPYVFMESLSDKTREDEIIFTDTGGTLIWTMQGLSLKGRQRVVSAFNHSPMGYALPASMGATLATGRPVLCITGDGGLQMNIQELATIRRHNLPVKIIVMNNHGYGIIKQTISTWLDGRYHSVDPKSGVGDPNYVAIAKAYGIPATRIDSHGDLDAKLARLLVEDGPMLASVEIHPEQKMEPKLVFGRPIEDSAPLLPRREFHENMIVEPIDPVPAQRHSSAATRQTSSSAVSSVPQSSRA